MASPLRRKKVLLPAAAAAIIFLVAVVPFLLSSTFILQLVLSTVNRKVPGELTIDSWLVGWRQGILCQQVVYDDPEQGIRVTVPRLTTNRGVLELAVFPSNLGTLIIDGPVVELAVPQPPAQVPPDLRPTEESSSIASSRSGRPFWDRISVDLHLRDGRVNMQPDGGDAVTGLRNCSIDAAIDDGVVTFDLNFQALHNQGKIRAGGTLNLPARRHGWVDTMIAEADMSIVELQVHEFLMLAGGRWHVPAGEGVLNADLHMKAVGFGGVRVSGRADFRDLALRGGFLGKDRPMFQEIHFNVDNGHWSDTGWSVEQFDLASDTGEIHGSGRYGGGEIQLAGRGSIDLPVLFDQFPDRLKLHEATFIERGALDFAIDLQRDSRKTSIELEAGADDLGGLYEGRPFSWTTPVTVLLEGEKIDHEARINSLRIDAPFLYAEGRGDLTDFVLEAAADLDLAFAEVGRLFQLEWNGTGRAEMIMNGRAFSMEDDRACIEADMQVSDFALVRAGEAVVPAHDLSLVASVQAPRTWFLEKRGTLDLQLALTTWLGEIFLAFDGEKHADESFRGYITTDSTLNLEAVSQALHTAAVMADDDAVAGELQVQAAGYLNEGSLEIRELQSEAAGFVLRRNGSVFTDNQIQLEIHQVINEDIPAFAIRDLVVADRKEEFLRTGAGFNLIDFADDSLFLRNLSLASETGYIFVKELFVEDWRHLLDNLLVNLDGDVHLDRLSRLLQGTGLLSLEADLAGRGIAAVHTAGTADDEREIVADVRLAGFGFTMENREILSGEEMSLNAVLHGFPDGNADIRSLLFRSRPLVLAATGVLRNEEEGQVMELQGETTPDLEQFASLLRSAFDLDLTMSGGRSEAFHIRFPLDGGGEKRTKVTFAGSLHVDELRYGGFEVRELMTPVSYAAGKLRLESNGSLNQGLLKISVEGDFSPKPPLLRIPENSRIMTGVELRKPLVDGLLSAIHPLFGVMAKPTGLLDVRLDTFSWPLQAGGGKDAAFIVVLDVRNIELESDTILKEILAWFNLDREKLTLRDNEIYCGGQAGRITCSPVRIRAGEAEMVLSGSVGMDKTLDYVLLVPITRKLVSEGVYQALGKTTVSVPVTGTVNRPSFDSKSVTEEIRDVVQKAAFKVMERQAEKISPEPIEDPLGGQIER
jgi:hypothetical protein